MRSTLFERYGALFGIIAAFLMPFKLSFGYAGLIPCISLLVLDFVRGPREISRPFNHPAMAAFILFLLVAALTSVFGINPLRSYEHIGTLVFFPLAIAAFYEIAKSNYSLLLGALCLGQSLSCLSTVLERAFPGYAPPFVGAVSQSGQITLTLFAAVAFLSAPEEGTRRISKADLALGVFLLAVMILLGFSREAGIPAIYPACLCGTIALFSVLTSKAESLSLNRSVIVRVVLPLIFAGLLVNLKRGPWIGVFAALSLFCFLHRPRLLLLLMTASAVSVLALNPVQSRLSHIYDHFFMTGGRNEIWEIGYELALKYPLGIGFENSGFLRLFSNEIPSNLKHFHSNGLNLLVETGWAGFALFVMSMVQFIALGFRRTGDSQQYRRTTALSCGLLAWQIAGIVEYNFGDSAVVSIAYLLMGVLLFESERASRSEGVSSAPSFRYRTQSLSESR